MKELKEEHYKRVIEKSIREMIPKKNVLWIYQLKLEFQTGWQYFLSSNSGIQ